MIQNEYMVLRKVKHKNIIRIYEIFQETDMVIYIMDYIPGGEIYHKLK